MITCRRDSFEDLAISGAPPAFADSLHVGRPNLGDRAALMRRIGEMLDRNWLTNDGPLVREFEERLADYLGVRHVVAMCNGSVALEIACRAAGLKGEVIVPSFTFVATAHALQWQEITPVFCDIDPLSHTMNPARVEELITPRTTGLLPVHLWGQPCAIEALATIAERRGLTLMFDAAHAFGSGSGDRMIGSFGRAEVMSFHATKFMNSFEGGAVSTNDAELAARSALMRNFGFVGYDRVEYVGTNGKMPEVAAAMGLTSLESLPRFLASNLENYEAYARRLTPLPGIRLLEHPRGERRNRQYVVIEINSDITGISRDDVMAALWAENIRARRYFYPGVHRMEPYRSFFPHAGLLLPVTEALADKVLVLPTGVHVGGAEIDTVCDIIRVCVLDGARVAKRIRGLDRSPAFSAAGEQEP
jgi:dTDP-4-amino-4,6-dideoxygalactose transaminase